MKGYADEQQKANGKKKKAISDFSPLACEYGF